MLQQRIISALVIIPILVAVVWFGDPWVSILAGFFALLGAYEFYRLRNPGRWHLLTVFGFILVLLFILNTHSDDARTTPLLITGTIIIPLAALLWRPESENAAVNWAWTVAGVFYLGWMLSHFIPLRDMDEGRDWVFIALFGTFASDTAAFFTGRAWGKHKMAPSISPGKTWEGAAGGVIGTMAATAVLAFITGLDEIGWARMLPLGFLISVFAQTGDLCESLIKRSVGAKDAGSLIPGHGGVLDRLDSITFTVVLVYYWVIWIV